MRFIPVFTVALFTLLSSAQLLSEGSSPCDDYWVSIKNQTQLDLYSFCTVFDSPIFVGHTFKGAFELPGIVSIGRVSSGYLLPKLTEREDDPVTSISFPDLKNTTVTYFGGVMAMYLNYLSNVSFPKLEYVTGEVVLVDNPKLRTAAFPALQTVTKGVLFAGPFDEISLPSLKKVGFLNVQSTGNLDCVALGKNLSSLIFTETTAPFGANLGFTCQTDYANNKWNSSDPKYNADTPSPSSSASIPSGTSGAAPTSTTGSVANATVTSSTSSAANPTGTSPSAGSGAMALNIGLINAVLAFGGIAAVGIF